MSAAANNRFRVGPESPLEGVSARAWNEFVTALQVQAWDAVSASGGLGAYDIRPRRLVEIGYAVAAPSVRLPTGRLVHKCEFVFPRTEKRFLKNRFEQHIVLVKSMTPYYHELLTGKLRRPTGMSVAGALAILHIGGLGAFKGWPKLFDNTRALYNAACRAF